MMGSSPIFAAKSELPIFENTKTYSSDWRKKKAKSSKASPHSKLERIGSKRAIEACAMLICRIKFEQDQLDSTQERLQTLRLRVEKEHTVRVDLEKQKVDIEKELQDLQKDIDRAQEKLSDSSAALAEANQHVDEKRESSRKTQRTLDRVLKEIASYNDEIERSASDRHAIYRRCRLEEIDLPLLSGKLNKVPIEEVQEDDAMAIDDDGTQRPAQVKDYGILPDFDGLEDTDKAVSHAQLLGGSDAFSGRKRKWETSLNSELRP